MCWVICVVFFLTFFGLRLLKKQPSTLFFFVFNIETPFLRLFYYTQVFNSKELKLGWKEEKLSIQEFYKRNKKLKTHKIS
jgi:hypothetical protein